MARWPHDLVSLRDRAMSRLKASTGITTAELREILCCQIEQQGLDGTLFLSLGERPSRRLLELSTAAQRSLLEWLEATRSWGKSVRLFPSDPSGAPLSLRGLVRALERGRKPAP